MDDAQDRRTEANGKLSESELQRVLGGTESGVTIDHTVVKTDTLWFLAKQYKTTIDDIMALNPFIENRNVLKIGWSVKIPDNR